MNDLNETDLIVILRSVWKRNESIFNSHIQRIIVKEEIVFRNLNTICIVW